MAATSLEERVARMEGLVEGIVARPDRLERELAEVRREGRSSFLWLLGIQITMWVTLMAAIVIRG